MKSVNRENEGGKKMPYVISFIKQKGGCGASTNARSILREYTALGWKTRLNDMDDGQNTSLEVLKWRIEHGKNAPELEIKQFVTVQKAMSDTEYFDMIIFDGRPRADTLSWEIAKVSDLVVMSTGTSKEDMNPQIRLAHEIKNKGFDPERICFVFFRTDSQAEVRDAREYIEAAGYEVLEPHLPNRTGYRRASDVGLCTTETRYPSLNRTARRVVQAIIDKFEAVAEL